MTPGFAAALFDPAAPVPAGLQDAQGRPAGRRFSVYRNNLAHGLAEALAALFPRAQALLGAEYFAALAGLFWRAHPPRGPVLAEWGDDFPAFLDRFPPLAHLPWIGDVARLERALVESYHAADAAPVPPERMTALPPDRLAAARLRLAPSLRWLASAHPVLDLWRAALGEAPPPAPGPQEVAVVRPGYDPAPVPLPAGGAAFLTALAAGRTLAEAAQAAGPGHDLTATFALLLAQGAITAIEEPRP
ncbi:MAG TPA: DNA-binding domain-containing protein [Paracoccaceae bacterium]|nr:DNA-binding domain-containing protein [Paracoccaceae bacterium]HMO70806.1 DNA-binding domain-containing protein [Paracoccaceae bacterium]